MMKPLFRNYLIVSTLLITASGFSGPAAALPSPTNGEPVQDQITENNTSGIASIANWFSSTSPGLLTPFQTFIASIASQITSALAMQTTYQTQIANNQLQASYEAMAVQNAAFAARTHQVNTLACQQIAGIVNASPNASGGNGTGIPAGGGLAGAQTNTLLTTAAIINSQEGCDGNAQGTGQFGVCQNGALSTTHQKAMYRFATYGDQTELEDANGDLQKSLPQGTKLPDPKSPLVNADILIGKSVFDVDTYTPPTASNTPTLETAAISLVDNIIGAIPPDPVRGAALTKNAGIQEHMRRVGVRSRLEVARAVLDGMVGERVAVAGAGNWASTLLQSFGFVQPGQPIPAGSSPSMVIPTDLSEHQMWELLMNKRFQDPTWYLNIEQGDTSVAERQTPELLAAVLMLNWKQYKLMEKMAAIQAAQLAVSVKEDNDKNYTRPN